MTAQPTPPDFDTARFRQVLGGFATGVCVITTLDEAGEPVGLTVNSFNAVSLQPPLVLWSLGLRAGSMPAFRACRRYLIHVLGAGQRELAERFAGPAAARFEGAHWAPGAHGLPELPGVLARFECFNRSRHEEGDHVIFVGEVERCDRDPEASPLLFHGGRFYAEHPL